MGRVFRSLAAAVVFVACTGGVGYTAVAVERLSVRVYDAAGMSSADRAHAMARAGKILGAARVPVEWRDCTPLIFVTHPSCRESPAKGELVVRLVRSGAPDASRALGEAFIDPVTGKGVLATVFVDRIEALAAAANADLPPLVARVTAHEIGHLLLGSQSHTDTGLMRETWTVKDVASNRYEDWMFSRGDINRLRRALRLS